MRPSPLPMMPRSTSARSAPRKRSGSTGVTGVTKTLSGKFQARIKLKGRSRINLGSDFNTKEEAAAAYAAAKQAGSSERPSPLGDRATRGTGTPNPTQTHSHAWNSLDECLLTAMLSSPVAWQERKR